MTTEVRDRRKYYRITEQGRRELTGARSFLRSLLAETAGRQGAPEG